jgi:4-hydroxythreonine-4-phosphate dehydrogenase
VTQSTIASTIGDRNGIGPEIAVKASAKLAREGGPAVVLVGDKFVVRLYADPCANDLTIRSFDGAAPRPNSLRLLAVDALPREFFCPGTPLAAGGRATVDHVAAAIRFVVGGGLRIVHVTLHERLHTVLGRITCELIERATRTADAARRKLNVEQPRIGLFGINPRADEGGVFGDDDDRITVPAANRLRTLGLNVGRPLGSDLMLGRRAFDAFVAMYHYPGRIPVKLPAGRNSVRLSIGSPLLFSSAGHGKVFDIADRGVAEPEAVLRSIQLLGGAHFGDTAVS